MSRDKFICKSCRVTLVRKKEPLVKEKDTYDDEGEEDDDEQDDVEMIEVEFQNIHKESALFHLNRCLEILNESPIDFCKTFGMSEKKIKLKNVFSVVKKKLFEVDDTNCDEEELLNHLQEKFEAATNDKNIQLQILTILPTSWSVRKIKNTFGATLRAAYKAKRLISNNGFLVSPTPRLGERVSEEIKKSVDDFYKTDKNSRVMPGKNDYVTVRKDCGEKIKEQKRLILCNLQELHSSFKDSFPHMKIGFSKFAELRPRECILSGGSGTHTVCVCTLHQNVKLMFFGGKISSLATDENQDFCTYHHWISQSICNPAQPKCYLGNCEFCPGDDQLKLNLRNAYLKSNTEHITYKQWVQVDRCDLITVVKPVDEFVDSIAHHLKKLITHSFIATEQNKFLENLKSNLRQGEYAVICDFAENYSFVIQDCTQNYHWTNSQATIHPFVIYYKNKDGKLQHFNFVVISDVLVHNTIAVHLFQRKLMQFLRANSEDAIKKISYFSDGSAAQYKNRKNFVNIAHHNFDFGCDAEWHFFATSHGKGPCDGVGGALKRAAAHASLQRPLDNQIVNARDLYLFAKGLEKINVEFCTQEEYSNEEQFLSPRFEKSFRLPGTQKLHSIIPASRTEIYGKIYSNDEEQYTPSKVMRS